MSQILPVLLMALAGVLLGGAWSLRRQQAPTYNVVLFAVLALVALGGGVLWLVPGE
ncbi:hypothetical protein GCM10010124_14320 [Pilimelia terevasa]|uniref:Uncharacterized protein n=1 Tax=Pilimelia terevasa TaxID=53372 RepID=A0A8J3BLD2_9ACTN|nr:hypothetical protein [Pilimelia terevasa]GGK22901.1 hypothetical protein GCM10010124_14320 [Pilimelia terevasa]